MTDYDKNIREIVLSRLGGISDVKERFLEEVNMIKRRIGYMVSIGKNPLDNKFMKCRMVCYSLSNIKTIREDLLRSSKIMIENNNKEENILQKLLEIQIINQNDEIMKNKIRQKFYDCFQSCNHTPLKSDTIKAAKAYEQNKENISRIVAFTLYAFKEIDKYLNPDLSSFQKSVISMVSDNIEELIYALEVITMIQSYIWDLSKKYIETYDRYIKKDQFLYIDSVSNEEISFRAVYVYCSHVRVFKHVI